jgi:geranylgeranyl reductase family protein
MITIIGAGPIGSYTAYLLAKNNYEISVFEEHKDIGLPVQCTGITTSSLKDIVPLKNDFVLNKIKKARIFSPNNKFLEINLKDENIILDRNKFDNHIADLAKKEGAKFILNHKFLDNKNDQALVKDKENDRIKEIRYDSLVGADGPLSRVAKSNDMFGKREFWQGIQARVKIKNENIVEFYPYFGTYAWLVPENEEIVRVGLVSKNHAPLLFNNFLFKFKNISKESILEYQAGIIPKYNPKLRTQKDTIYIVGDAACQVKATTGGGIIPGLLASKALACSIYEKKDYETEWKKSIGKELYFHLKARNIMDKFKQKDWNNIIDCFEKPEIKKILEENDRENISKIIFKAIVKKPSLLYFIRYLV